MASTKQLIYLEGVNIKKKISYIKNMEELLEIRQRYFHWYGCVQELVSATPYVAKFARIDNSLSDYMHNGGAGIDVKWDERTRHVIKLLKSSTEDILNFIEVLHIPDKVVYRSDQKALFFDEIKIVLTDRAQSREIELLNVLFSEKPKKWSMLEIKEKLGPNLFNRPEEEEKRDYPKNAFYQAGKSINKKVSEGSTIKDFLLISTKDIQINPKYF